MPNYSNSTSEKSINYDNYGNYEDDYSGSGSSYENSDSFNLTFPILDGNQDFAEDKMFYTNQTLLSDSDEGLTSGSGSGSPTMIDQNVTFSTNFEETTNKITFHSIDQSTIFPSSTEIGSTIAHGFGSGLVNIAMQGTSMYLAKKGYSESKISAVLLSLTSGILQASYAATFPLMLFELNKLVAEGNDQEAQARWEMMTQKMLPVFFTSLTLSTGLQLLNYFSKNYLSKQPMLKGLIQSIPAVSTLYNAIQNPILAGIHATTAYAVSTLGLFGHNLNINKENRRNTNIEINEKESENSVELISLKKEKNDINNPIASTSYNQQFFKNSSLSKNSAASLRYPEEMNEGTGQLLKK